MVFEGQYLTYNDYEALVESLGGSTIEETPFNLLEFQARRKIDIRTQNRLKETEYAKIPQEVKLCVFELVNAVNGFAQATANITKDGNVASENTDGYSISYLTPDKITDIVNSKNNEIEDIIRTYLLGVIFNNEHLMYVGVK